MRLQLPGVHFGHRLRCARLMRRWPIGALAVCARIPDGSLLLLEHGAQEPTLPELMRLSDALDVTLDWLLKGAP